MAMDESEDNDESDPEGGHGDDDDDDEARGVIWPSTILQWKRPGSVNCRRSPINKGLRCVFTQIKRDVAYNTMLEYRLEVEGSRHTLCLHVVCSQTKTSGRRYTASKVAVRHAKRKAIGRGGGGGDGGSELATV